MTGTIRHGLYEVVGLKRSELEQQAGTQNPSPTALGILKQMEGAVGEHYTSFVLYGIKNAEVLDRIINQNSGETMPPYTSPSPSQVEARMREETQDAGDRPGKGPLNKPPRRMGPTSRPKYGDGSSDDDTPGGSPGGRGSR